MCHDYARGMRRLPRPHSRGFHAMLAMALFAWVMLASGALAAPARLAGMLPVDSIATAAHCEGMPAPGTSTLSTGYQNHTPGMPVGHGDCCHGGCHCSSVCNAVLMVPRLTTTVPAGYVPLPVSVPVDPALLPAAPPLRPPIA